MTSFFGVGGNPFATVVGQRIEQATDPSLASENWALNLEICDIINDTEDGPKDAIKAIRKRLQQNAGKNYTVIMYTLTVLETCVKNCGKRFHILACNKEFVQELVKLIEPYPASWLNLKPYGLPFTSPAFLMGPKNDPPTAVQEKVLSLIQSWADAFRTQPDMSGVVAVYQELKLKGIEFPMTDLDMMAPIHTPQRSIPNEVAVGIPALTAQQEGSLGGGGMVVGAAGVPVGVAVMGACLTQDQLAKLHGELDVVQANVAVLGEMLTELTPGKEHPSDVQLLKELHGTCRAMQQRLVELISKLANDEVTAELLRINDLLNNIFLRYARFEKNRDAGASQNLAADGAAPSKPSASVAMPASLIDLSDEASSAASTVPVAQLTSHIATLGVGDGASSQLASLNSVSARKGPAAPAREDSEFDMFAQSRNVTYETSKMGGSSYEANLKPDQMSGGLGAITQSRGQAPQSAMHKESDFDEMAAWLGDGAGPEESLTSSEFERFLAERAAAVEALPTPPTNTPSTASPSPRHRKANKQTDGESSMFAL